MAQNSTEKFWVISNPKGLGSKPQVVLKIWQHRHLIGLMLNEWSKMLWKIDKKNGLVKTYDICSKK